MQTALVGKSVLTVEEYRKGIGLAVSSPGAIAPSAPIACRICGHPMSLRVPGSFKRISHFVHLSGAKSCPSSLASAKQYSILVPTRPSAAAGAALRSLFKANWGKHWHEFQAITDHGSVNEFVEMLRRANRYRVWEYRGLEEWHIPYVLVALADFPRKNSVPDVNGQPLRQYYLRFWFAGGHRTLEGRWNLLSRAPDLMRAEFIDRGNGRRPSAAYVVSVDVVPVSAAFLTRSVSPAGPVPATMAAFFKKHPKLFR
jgi:hypothetical protein